MADDPLYDERDLALTSVECDPLSRSEVPDVLPTPVEVPCDPQGVPLPEEFLPVSAPAAPVPTPEEPPALPIRNRPFTAVCAPPLTSGPDSPVSYTVPAPLSHPPGALERGTTSLFRPAEINALTDSQRAYITTSLQDPVRKAAVATFLWETIQDEDDMAALLDAFLPITGWSSALATIVITAALAEQAELSTTAQLLAESFLDCGYYNPEVVVCCLPPPPPPTYEYAPGEYTAAEIAAGYIVVEDPIPDTECATTEAGTFFSLNSQEEATAMAVAAAARELDCIYYNALIEVSCETLSPVSFGTPEEARAHPIIVAGGSSVDLREMHLQEFAVVGLAVPVRLVYYAATPADTVIAASQAEADAIAYQMALAELNCFFPSDWLEVDCTTEFPLTFGARADATSVGATLDEVTYEGITTRHNDVFTSTVEPVAVDESKTVAVTSPTGAFISTADQSEATDSAEQYAISLLECLWRSPGITCACYEPVTPGQDVYFYDEVEMAEALNKAPGLIVFNAAKSANNHEIPDGSFVTPDFPGTDISAVDPWATAGLDAICLSYLSCVFCNVQIEPECTVIYREMNGQLDIVDLADLPGQTLPLTIPEEYADYAISPTFKAGLLPEVVCNTDPGSVGAQADSLSRLRPGSADAICIYGNPETVVDCLTILTRQDRESEFPDLTEASKLLSVTVPENTFQAGGASEQEAITAAIDAAIAYGAALLQCEWGNDQLTGGCEYNDYDESLSTIGEVDAEIFRSIISKEDANRQAQIYVDIETLCFYCNDPKTGECDPEHNPDLSTIVEVDACDFISQISKEDANRQAQIYVDLGTVCAYCNDEREREVTPIEGVGECAPCPPSATPAADPNEGADCGAYNPGISNIGEIIPSCSFISYVSKIDANETARAFEKATNVALYTNDIQYPDPCPLPSTSTLDPDVYVCECTVVSAVSKCQANTEAKRIANTLQICVVKNKCTTKYRDEDCIECDSPDEGDGSDEGDCVNEFPDPTTNPIPCLEIIPDDTTTPSEGVDEGRVEAGEIQQEISVNASEEAAQDVQDQVDAQACILAESRQNLQGWGNIALTVKCCEEPNIPNMTGEQKLCVDTVLAGSRAEADTQARILAASLITCLYQNEGNSAICPGCTEPTPLSEVELPAGYVISQISIEDANRQAQRLADAQVLCTMCNDEETYTCEQKNAPPAEGEPEPPPLFPNCAGDAVGNTPGIEWLFEPASGLYETATHSITVPKCAFEIYATLDQVREDITPDPETWPRIYEDQCEEIKDAVNKQAEQFAYAELGDCLVPNQTIHGTCDPLSELDIVDNTKIACEGLFLAKNRTIANEQAQAFVVTQLRCLYGNDAAEEGVPELDANGDIVLDGDGNPVNGCPPPNRTIKGKVAKDTFIMTDKEAADTAAKALARALARCLPECGVETHPWKLCVDDDGLGQGGLELHVTGGKFIPCDAPPLTEPDKTEALVVGKTEVWVKATYSTETKASSELTEIEIEIGGPGSSMPANEDLITYYYIGDVTVAGAPGVLGAGAETVTALNQNMFQDVHICKESRDANKHSWYVAEALPPSAALTLTVESGKVTDANGAVFNYAGGFVNGFDGAHVVYLQLNYSGDNLTSIAVDSAATLPANTATEEYMLIAHVISATDGEGYQRVTNRVQRLTEDVVLPAKAKDSNHSWKVTEALPSSAALTLDVESGKVTAEDGAIFNYAGGNVGGFEGAHVVYLQLNYSGTGGACAGISVDSAATIPPDTATEKYRVIANVVGTTDGEGYQRATIIQRLTEDVVLQSQTARVGQFDLRVDDVTVGSPTTCKVTYKGGTVYLPPASPITISDLAQASICSGAYWLKITRDVYSRAATAAEIVSAEVGASPDADSETYQYVFLMEFDLTQTPVYWSQTRTGLIVLAEMMILEQGLIRLTTVDNATRTTYAP